MRWGRVQQVIRDREGFLLLEVLNPDTFERRWRRLEQDADVRESDYIRWDSDEEGYVSRHEVCLRRPVGRLSPAAPVGFTRHDQDEDARPE